MKNSETMDSESIQESSQKSNSRLRNVKRWLPGLLISAIAFYAVFHLVSLDELVTALSAINLLYLIPGVIFVIIWLFFRAMALKFILSGNASLSQTFRAINVGYLLNNILPLRAGEFGKAIVLGQSSGLGVSQVLSGIVIERACDLFYAAVLLLAVLPLALEMSWTKPVAIVVLVLVVCGFFALFLLAKKKEAIQEWIAKMSGKWPWVKKYIQPQIASFLDGFALLTDFRQFLISLLTIGMAWGVAILMYFVMMYSIIPAPKLWWGIFVNSILAMGIAIPSAPAALGVFEASMVAALKVLGVSYSSALAYAVILHFVQIAITTIFGVYALLKEKRSLESVFNLSQKIKQKDESENPVTGCAE